MIDKTLFDQYKSALKVNADLLESAILALDGKLAHLSGKSLEVALAANYALLVQQYGSLAAQCAVEFYTTLRAGANLATEYTATQTAAQSSEYLVRDAQNVMKLSANVSNVTKNLAGRAVQRVYEQADNTLIDNANRDPAHPRWALVPTVGACGWCVLIGSQGFVYHSDTTASRARHAHCRCTPVVDFDTKNPHLDGYNVTTLRSSYSKCRASIADDARATWDSMSDVEQKRYDDSYDKYLRNRIVSEMNTRNRNWLRTNEPAKVVYQKPEALLTSNEKAAVTYLVSNGVDLTVLSEDGAANANIDFFMFGTEYEAKNVTTESSVSNQIKRVRIKWYKLGRTDAIKAVFTCEDSLLAYSDVCEAVRARMRKDEEIIVLSKDSELTKIKGH